MHASARARLARAPSALPVQPPARPHRARIAEHAKNEAEMVAWSEGEARAALRGVLKGLSACTHRLTAGRPRVGSLVAHPEDAARAR